MSRVGTWLKTIALLLIIAVTGGYSWYQIAYSKCRTPLTYSIGVIDPQFGISKDEVRTALSDAESLWEDATGKNLFTYTEEGGDLLVSFTYDERQETTEAKHELEQTLDQKAEVSESIKADYEKLVASYETLKADYKADVASYEKRLADHNAEVARWNEKGGAPDEVYQKLTATAEALNSESTRLNATAKKLNTLVAQINDIGSKQNRVVRDYNDDVARYNDAFSDAREFTQGDYQAKRITIYQYDNGTELRRVLAHELGHALGLDHVEDDQAVMYFLMEGQPQTLALTTADIAAYTDMCGVK